LAGSFFVENLTDEMERAAQDYIDKIDVMGGAVEAIESGYIQNEIAAAAYQYQVEIEEASRILVGVNKFTQEAETVMEAFQIDESIRKIQSDQISVLKTERNNANVEKALKELKAAASSETNIMPFILTAVEDYATLGEIADVLRSVFGEY